MSDKPGKDLENLAAVVFDVLRSHPEHVVSKDVELPGADGPRQIDVVVRSEVGPVEVLTVVECKDTARKVTVAVVDAFHSVMMDVGANKGVLVSRKGFSGTARNKAKRLGVSLLVADRLSNLSKDVAQVSIVVRELRPTSVTAQLDVYFPAGTTIDQSSVWTVNDQDLLHLLSESLASQAAPPAGGRHGWTPETLRRPYFIRDADGEMHTFPDLELTYEIQERRFYGHLSDVESVIYLHDVSRNARTLLLSEEVLTRPDLHYREFGLDEPPPFEPQLDLSVIAIPDPDRDVVRGPVTLRYTESDNPA